MNTKSFFTGITVGAISALALMPWETKAVAPKLRPTPTQSPINTARQAIVTAYCPCSDCCGKSADGVTSRGRNAWATRGVAVDPKRIPYGSRVTIDGVGTFIADDTGGAMRRNPRLHIDLRFHSHQEALEWGVKYLLVWVEEKDD